MAESTTIAAMLKATAIKAVTANSEVHMASLLVRVMRAGKSGRSNAAARFWFLGFRYRMQIFGDQFACYKDKIMRDID